MHRYRSLVLPLAIVAGFFLHSYFALLKIIVPFLLFFILLLNFSAVEIRTLKLSPLHGWLLLFQLTVSLVAYFAICPFNEILAQGVFIGILCPVAASVVVVASMLGANRATITTYSLVGNFGIAFFAPIYFSFIGQQQDLAFSDSFLLIFFKIAPILALPFVLIIVLQLFWPKANDFISKFKGLSFYLWAIALMITIGQTIDFVFLYGASHQTVIIMLTVASLLGCALQFTVGKAIGTYYGDCIAGGQGLGQRNTALAIWMATMYLNPLASIFPATYSIWQNIYNSWQLWRYSTKTKQ